MKKVQNVFKTNQDQLFSVIACLFPNGCPKNEGFVEEILSILGVDKNKLIEMLDHEVSMPSDYKTRKGVRENRWWFSSIIGYSAGWALRLHSLKKLVPLIGENKFSEYVFVEDSLGLAPIIRAIRFNFDALKYMFSFKQIVERCSSDKQILYII